jgi:tRNA A64-2'-O-ribosylphosphate transferase
VYQLTKSGDGKEEQDGIVVKFYDDEANAQGGVGVGRIGEGIGGPFVEMGALTSALEARSKEQHLCGEDLYNARWKFGGGMVGERRRAGEEGEEGDGMWWEVQYDVTGPKKGYVSETRYTREA